MKKYALYSNNLVTIFPRKEVNEKNFRELLKNVDDNAFVIEVTKDRCSDYGYSFTKYCAYDENKSRSFVATKSENSLEERIASLVNDNMFKRGIINHSIYFVNNFYIGR